MPLGRAMIDGNSSGEETRTLSGREGKARELGMRKTIMALLLMFALAGAALAAPVELIGSLGTEIGYLPGEDLEGTTYLQLSLESKLQGNVTGVFGYRFNSYSDEVAFDWYAPVFSSSVEEPIYAYVQSTGSLWEGAAPVKLTLGSLDVKYSPYVAWLGYNTRLYFPQGTWESWNFNGVALDEVKLGAVDARAFCVFDNDNTRGVNFKGDFADVKLDATIVKFDESAAYDFKASLSPVKELDLTGRFVGDGVAPEGWYDFALGFSGVPGWQLGASYRDFSAALFDDYLYRDQTPSVVDGEFVVMNPYDLNKGCQGLILTADTSLAGYNLSGQYDYAIRTTQFQAAQDNWSAKLKLFHPLIGSSLIDGKYIFRFGEEIKSLLVLRGSATGDIAALRGVKLEGVAEFADEAVFGGSATYEAPNGLSVTAEYYSDDLKDDNGLNWIQEQGFSLYAGYELDF